MTQQTRTLGPLIKRRRKELHLTQRELADKLRVKASHVAYMENNRRRPSISLVMRLAHTLGMSQKDIFLLAHPEAKQLLEGDNKPRKPQTREEVWRTFAGNWAVIARHAITPQELKVLKCIGLCLKVRTPSQFLFILNSIRAAIEDEIFG